MFTKYLSNELVLILLFSGRTLSDAMPRKGSVFIADAGNSWWFLCLESWVLYRHHRSGGQEMGRRMTSVHGTEELVPGSSPPLLYVCNDVSM